MRRFHFLIGFTFLSLLFVGCTENAVVPASPAATSAPTPVSPPPASSPGRLWISPMDEMPLVYVPAGSFLMGSSQDDPELEADEIPQRKVNLPAYWIDQFEVTNRMYADCVAEEACTLPAEVLSLTRLRYYGDFSFAEYPVVMVSWEQARQYCQWAGRRLPTEAEWEKAARGTDGRRYPWGDQPPTCERLSFGNPGPGKASCSSDTTRVGAYLDGASPYGVFDMAGNVWEWVADWYAPDAYATLPAENPTGPPAGANKVLRGGSFTDPARLVRSANRHQTHPDNVSYLVGFRCAQTAAP